MTDLELVDTLKALQLGPRRQGREWIFRCPVHDDKTPSASARIGNDGKLLVHCHAGCSFLSIIAALGLRNQDFTTRPVNRARVIQERKPDPSVLVEWARIVRADPEAQVEGRERSLGIPVGGLRRLGAAWAVGIGALAAPMMDAPGGQIIGVRIRADDGKKWALAGSKNGLFVPVTFVGTGPIYMPEGLTDTAALCGLGMDAIGRPSCTGGRDLCRAAARMAGREVVVVSDRDAPGRLGADQLAAEIKAAGLRVKVLLPPPGMKDIRQWIAGGAGRADIEFAVRNKACI